MNEEEKALVRAWKKGMEEVNRITQDENRRRTPEERLQRVMVLMASRDIFDRDHVPSAELTAPQRRWVEASERLRGRS